MYLRSMDLLSELLLAQKAKKNPNSNSNPFMTVRSYTSIIYSIPTHTKGKQDPQEPVNEIYRSTNIDNLNNDRINDMNNNFYEGFEIRDANGDHDNRYNNDRVRQGLNLNKTTCI